MNVLITGSTGLVGSKLVSFLESQEHHVLRLVRTRSKTDTTQIYWDPANGDIDASGLESLDGVVHLAGENIAGGRWTTERKARIRSSRETGTRLLAETLAGLNRQPRVLVSASAIGYYGDRADESLTETSTPGTGFLSDTCVAWENAAQPAIDAGIRTVFPRIGIVLSADGGALAKMLFPFKLGLGGVLGNGTQYMSWISLDDLVGVIFHALETDDLQGPVNAVSPEPATNRTFTKTLGHVLSRPTLFPVPAFAARLAFGEMADALLLSSTRVRPTRLQQTDYNFQHPNLENALRHALQ
ncbi:MAG: TIGR01777 family oxidoreductase [bacterium]|nr:TIGR01777 family oxidoreductase [bacterium]